MKNTNYTLLEETIRDYRENCSGEFQSEEAVPYLLFSLVVATRPKAVVEIGPYRGLSSFAIASGLKFNSELEPPEFFINWKRKNHPIKEFKKVKGKLFCIDPVLEPHFKRRLEKFSELKEYISFIQKKSEEIDLDKFDKIDLLFIDGDHTYKSCRNDFIKFYPKISSGGLAIIHDYFPDAPVIDEPWWGPNLFIKQVREAFGFSDSLVIDTGFNSLAIFRRKIDYLDYPFLSTNYLKGFFYFLLNLPQRGIKSLISKIKRFL